MKRIFFIVIAMLANGLVAAADFDGVLSWGKRVELGLAVSGVIETVAVQPGQRVNKDDLLLALDDRYLKARVAKAEAELTESKLANEEGQRELDRANELYDRTVLSDHDLQMAQIGASRTKAALHKAQAELAEARTLLQQSQIKAPFDGIIVDLSAQPGQAIASGLEVQTLVTLAQDSLMRVTTQVSVDQLNSLSLQQVAKVEVAGQSFDATVNYIGLEPSDASSESPLYDLEVIFERPESVTLRVGVPAIIRIN